MARRDPSGRPAAHGVAGGSELATYRDRARRLGLPFVSIVDGRVDPPGEEAGVHRATFARLADGRGALIAPGEDDLDSVRAWLARYPGSRRHLGVATPTAIRTALRTADAGRVAAAAVRRLAALDPLLSAKRVITAPQAAIAVATVIAVAAAVALWPVATLLSLNLLAGAFFFGVTVLRFIAAQMVPRRLGPADAAPPSPGEDMPVYTVLVPLRGEANIVAELVAALDRLAWPKDRLDVKLIVEADDPATRLAVERAVRGPPYEIVVVPAGEPRTKPKALDFALAYARGSLVTIYDAEDRPEPHQLTEAWRRFRRSDPTVACLQAPIVIRNRRASLLARSFAVEYSTLFDGLLPALAALRLPLPLGGTSNHFKRAALERVGAWDPYNVTEDADLGIRLARFGYRSETLALPTYEEAPASLGPWLRQRTRWFKGWLQTWLVHMRQPVRFAREIGLRQFVAFNLIGAGMLISAIIHPVYLATLVMIVADPLSLWQHGDYFGAAVVGLNLFNLVAGYFAVVLLAARTLRLRGRGDDLPVLAGLPLYWLLMAVACARALVHLVRRPHHWEKTPHVGAGREPPGRRPTAEQRRRPG